VALNTLHVSDFMPDSTRFYIKLYSPLSLLGAVEASHSLR
jgi:hypothetical protein